MLDTRPTRLAYQVELSYDVRAGHCDFLFCVQAARTPHQTVVREQLHLSQPVPVRELQAAGNTSRRLHVTAMPGPLVLRYDAEVDVIFHHANPADVAETWVRDLPAEVLPYLCASRYCESDLMAAFALREFGAMWQGHGRVQAICDWVQRHIAFESGSSLPSTTAMQTLTQGRGVCRDSAHVMIAICRALNMPARFTTGLDYGADPALGPPDFHAYVEVYLSGRWYLFDPSGTAIPRGLLRISTGLDAADNAYATLFGDVQPMGRRLFVTPVADAQGHTTWPQRTAEALSTAAS
ncbi:MAG: transglutaminase family protein [Burkholderiaceae bacterium]|nr:transglutaminase family protein [Burkholderiaceae bacterium]